MGRGVARCRPAMAEREVVLCFRGPEAGGAARASGAGRSGSAGRLALGLAEQQEPASCSHLPRSAAGGVGGVGRAFSESVSHRIRRCGRASR